MLVLSSSHVLCSVIIMGTTVQPNFVRAVGSFAKMQPGKREKSGLNDSFAVSIMPMHLLSAGHPCDDGAKLFCQTPGMCEGNKCVLRGKHLEKFGSYLNPNGYISFPADYPCTPSDPNSLCQSGTVCTTADNQCRVGGENTLFSRMNRVLLMFNISVGMNCSTIQACESGSICTSEDLCKIPCESYTGEC